MNIDILMDQYQALKEQAEQIKTQMDTLKSLMIEQLPQGGEAGGHKVIVTAPRISWTQVAKAYPADKHPELYTAQFDSNVAKQNLAPAELENYRSGNPTVSIR